MTNRITRRHVLKAGAALGATAFAAPHVSAQGARKATKVLDFETYADVAKAEAEGSFVFYCHENEAGTAAIMEGFQKDFPKIKTSYVRAQTGALYNKILSERSAGRFDVDVLQLSDIAPAVDFEKKKGYELYTGPYMDAYKKDYLSETPGAFFWTGVTFAGLAYNNKKVTRRGSAEDLQGHQRSALAQQDLLQDFVVRHPVRAVVSAAPDSRQRLLEGVRQAAPEGVRLTCAAVRPPRQG